MQHAGGTRYILPVTLIGIILQRTMAPACNSGSRSLFSPLLFLHMSDYGIVFQDNKVPSLFSHLAAIFGDFLMVIHHGNQLLLPLGSGTPESHQFLGKIDKGEPGGHKEDKGDIFQDLGLPPSTEDTEDADDDRAGDKPQEEKGRHGIFPAQLGDVAWRFVRYIDIHILPGKWRMKNLIRGIPVQRGRMDNYLLPQTSV